MVINMIKKWLLSNLIGIIMSVVILIFTFGLLYSLLHRNEIITESQNIPLRTGPGIAYSQKEKLKRHTKLHILSRRHGWYKVRCSDNEKVGWIAGWLPENQSLQKITPLSESTIVLDAGHGGNDTGALSNDNNHYEKTYTLSTVKKIQQQLVQQGARVILTRKDDTLVPLLHIPTPAQKQQADAFISIHYDSSSEDNTASGISQYYYHQSNGSKQLAESLSQKFNDLPLHNRGVDTAGYIVIKNNSRPAVLLEMGFINNDDDFQYIRSQDYQQKIAQRITSGLDNYIRKQIAD